ncbi:hypothetical protein B0H13DRAFT_2291264 [Mycena leptocephala]|nr:hypothetical protein B0H13DRAFT_2291264 [Mycena leptocephala]
MLFTETGLAALAFVFVSSAVPTVAVGGLSAAARFFPIFPIVTVCIDSLSDPAGCLDIQVSSGNCVDLLYGLSSWNQAISQAQIPDGFVCTQFDCVGGSMSFFPGEADFFPAFNDVTSSLSCVTGSFTTLTVCIGSLSDPGCVGIPVASGNCIDLTGGLSSWNQAISQAQIPPGSVCTFFDQFDVATLTLCIDSLVSATGCVETFVTSQSCIDLTGSLSSWNQAISQAQISDGFSQFECVGNSMFFGSGVANLFPGFNDCLEDDIPHGFRGQYLRWLVAQVYFSACTANIYKSYAGQCAHFHPNYIYPVRFTVSARQSETRVRSPPLCSDVRFRRHRANRTQDNWVIKMNLDRVGEPTWDKGSESLQEYYYYPPPPQPQPNARG